jgi:hypothetical protein
VREREINEPGKVREREVRDGDRERGRQRQRKRERERWRREVLSEINKKQILFSFFVSLCVWPSDRF